RQSEWVRRDDNRASRSASRGQDSRVSRGTPARRTRPLPNVRGLFAPDSEPRGHVAAGQHPAAMQHRRRGPGPGHVTRYATRGGTRYAFNSGGRRLLTQTGGRKMEDRTEIVETTPEN